MTSRPRLPILSNARAVEVTSTTARLAVDYTYIDVPSILVQALIEPFAAHADGIQIRTLGPAWNAIAGLLREDPDALFRIEPRRLEELVAASYELAGYDEVVLTPRSGDYGRDVIATKFGWGSVRIIDQVKAYGPLHRVTANDVRALLGVLSGDRLATKGVVTTTSDFAPMIGADPFIAPFVPYRLELVNGIQLLERIWGQKPSIEGNA